MSWQLVVKSSVATHAVIVSDWKDHSLYMDFNRYQATGTFRPQGAAGDFFDIVDELRSSARENGKRVRIDAHL